MLVWNELEEESAAHRALSQVLFAVESVNHPDDAPARDLSDEAVRRNLFACALKHPEVRTALEKVLEEIESADKPRAWWKFW